MHSVPHHRHRLTHLFAMSWLPDRSFGTYIQRMLTMSCLLWNLQTVYALQTAYACCVPLFLMGSAMHRHVIYIYILSVDPRPIDTTLRFIVERLLCTVENGVLLFPHAIASFWTCSPIFFWILPPFFYILLCNCLSFDNIHHSMLPCITIDFIIPYNIVNSPYHCVLPFITVYSTVSPPTL